MAGAEGGLEGPDKIRLRRIRSCDDDCVVPTIKLRRVSSLSDLSDESDPSKFISLIWFLYLFKNVFLIVMDVYYFIKFTLQAD